MRRCISCASAGDMQRTIASYEKLDADRVIFVSEFIYICANMLLKFYLIVGLKQNHVIFTEHSQENDGRHILETMNPFSSLGSLSTYVHHSVGFTHIDFVLLFPLEFLNYRKMIESRSKGYSMIPVVG